MTRRILGVVVLVAMALTPACSTLGDYPSGWHEASNSIHVYGSVPTRTIELPASAQKTVFDLAFDLGLTGSQMSRVVVFRRSGSRTTQFDIDVLDMIRTGKTVNNMLMQPGDVVGIKG